MSRKRFSKPLVLAVLARRVRAIQVHQQFDLNNGTAQFWPRHVSDAEKARISRAVEYGRMQAYRQLAEDIDAGFYFEPDDVVTSTND